MSKVVNLDAAPLKKALGAESARATVRFTKKRQPTRAVITITEKGTSIDVRCEFAPMAKTIGSLAPAHAAAMHAVKAIAAWAKGDA